MWKRRGSTSHALLAVLCAMTAPGGAVAQDAAKQEPAATPKLPKILFVTQSKGFVHPVVRRAQRAILAHAERCLTEAAKGRWRVECTQDISEFPKGMEDVDALLFYTTGDLPLDEKQRNALLEWIEAGGAFAGVHSATDTFHKWPEYGAMIGGYFEKHPWHQKVRVLLDDKTHPILTSLAGAGDFFEIEDEIYQFKGQDLSTLRVLLSLDPKSVAIERGSRKDGRYPLAWCREYGKGRVFYTALGHRPEVWRDVRFLNVLLHGLDWATGREPQAYPSILPWQDLLENGLKNWRPVKGAKPRWKYENGVLEIAPSSSSLVTRDSFGDCRLELEFMLPEGTPERGGDSGIVLQHHYEIQLLDGRGVTKPNKTDCGAIYGMLAPAVHAGKGPGVWQTLAIEFRAPLFDARGKKTDNARVTVDLNGTRIHDDVEIPDRTQDQRPESPGEAGIVIEDRGERVRFRKIRIARIPARERRAAEAKRPEKKAGAGK